MRNIFKLFVAAIIVTMGLLGSTAVNAAEKLPQSLYIKQDGEKTCTLAAATMMIRARLFLSGYENWSSCTEADARKTGWEEGAGLRWNFTYSIGGNKLSVAHASVNGMTVSGLKKLLDAHPEGIEIYCRSIPHAVFVTDYEGDTFYCADSASKCSGVRRTLASSWLVNKPSSKFKTQKDILAGINDYWYIKSYSIKPTKYEGVFKVDGVWKYYSGGVFRDDVTSVVKRTDNNTWWFVKNGIVQFDVTSVVKRADNNTWWYVKNGQVQFGVTSVVKRADNGTWWYVKNGQVQFGVTSVVKRTDNNTWWYVKGGKVQFGVTSIVKRTDNNTWWHIKDGQVQFGVTGVVERADNSTWWYVKNGQVQFGMTSVEKRADNDTWWFVKNGRVQFGVTNVVKRIEDSSWWYVKGGKAQTDKSGIVRRTDNNTWWYVENGRVQFDKDGVFDGITIGDYKYEWTFRGGKLIAGYPDEAFAFEEDYVISDGKVWYYIENEALYTQDTETEQIQ
ncbi:MAG: hypothetical protein IKR26_00440 [Lachnospiraceae bacterium]|nr:hypothetical protein [Lachnospiraceae bacterium]